MPQVHRSTKAKVETKTVDGEVTINLNLSITIDDNGSVKVSPSVESTEPKKVVDSRPREEIIPTELLSAGDDLIDGFGD